MQAENSDYDNGYFTSSELSLCAALITLGFPLYSLDKTNPQKAVFVFKYTPDLDKTIEEFWSKQLRIEPISFFEAQRFVKSRIYGG
ncbi:hypothetical protein A3A70_03045 [candidate division WWE3 bacterium RIFCSPLOWO2_01_FULL_42_11]|uniref:DUF5659 domain-containing protein n=2 Tax=Bacteria candidate phyla TaxID=1783234 RepID=A0A1F4VRM7_UNCKA|nr:MAG: hypothetical protein A3A70_03045 [candidate division WWE3 bacterium RIFCSPLOWO2_01_FULL_42_11]OGG15303.1 MAG: hypothetical protein A2773_03140 [Candidatus Gottesmanbacteria bacterium RIFCSPHIGHO2_01_FULL_39_10]